MAHLDEKSEKVVRAEINVAENSRLLAVAIAIFVVIFIYKDVIPVALFGWVIAQLVLSFPLFYKSSDGYEKLAYRDELKWKWFAKLLNSTGTALVFNAIAIIIYSFSLAFSLIFFGVTWGIEIIYSILDIKERRANFKKRLFKSLWYLSLQIIFGLGIILFYQAGIL
ncbi:MAG: hypothetical protein ACTSRS_16560 [Candidatus Helarchaeota archaeon]